MNVAVEWECVRKLKYKWLMNCGEHLGFVDEMWGRCDVALKAKLNELLIGLR